MHKGTGNRGFEVGASGGGSEMKGNGKGCSGEMGPERIASNSWGVGGLTSPATRVTEPLVIRKEETWPSGAREQSGGRRMLSMRVGLDCREAGLVERILGQVPPVSNQ